MKPRFTTPHVAYRPDAAEIYNAGKQAAQANRGTIGAKPNLAMLRQHLPLFQREPIEAQLEALEVFREGWRWER